MITAIIGILSAKTEKNGKYEVVSASVDSWSARCGTCWRKELCEERTELENKNKELMSEMALRFTSKIEDLQSRLNFLHVRS